MFVYLAVDALFLLVWCILFLRRKDLRWKMLLASLIVLPFGIFDYLSQPNYWHPPTFFSWPRGISIEALLGGFGIGGVAAVLYDEIAKKHLRKFKRKAPSTLAHFVVPLSVVACAMALYFGAGVNMMIGLPIGLAVGVVAIALVRPDLRKVTLLSSLYFGVLYFLIFFAWLSVFPEARTWWNLDVYWGASILGVPLGEALFGFLFGAFWGPIFEFCFDYKLR